ncbi:MAG: Ig-like domain-containing protein [Treponema sp.]|jgi:hypothetical protein|nr:Ig-like domain-containing protein [Treponema sp.]
MKKTRPFLVLIAAALIAANCVDGPLEPGALDDLEIGLTKLTLSHNELATISENELDLTLTKNPGFANKNGVVWESSDPDAAAVDQNGHITAGSTTTEVLSAVIKVYAVDDPSIYALCPVSVYPDYGSSRSWDFASSVTTSGDTDYSQGMTILGGTGSGTYNSSPAGPGLYEIDPDDPYQYGLTPTSGSRGSITFNNDTSGAEGFSTKSLRTGGMGRILKIAAIQGPFTVTVNYQSNGADARWADIRFGDKEGIRYQGDPAAGTNAAGCRTVSWPYAGDDIVPFVYIEASAAIRIYDVIITPGATYPYTPVPDSFTITGADSFIKGETETYTTSITQNLTNPSYEWEITSGGEYAEITRRVDGGKSVELKALDPGSVTLQVTITTSNPYDLTVTPKTVTQPKTITIGGYTPITGVSIDSDTATTVGGTVQLSAGLTPQDATNPVYEWIITEGGDYGEIASGGTAQTVTLNGTAVGSFKAKVKVTTQDPANPSSTHTAESNECTVTVNAPASTVTWLFNATTAAAARLSTNSSGHYEITIETIWGDGLTLLPRTSGTAHAIRPTQASGGITGCLQMGGTENFAKITGVTGSCTLELKYSGTGGGQIDKRPTVSIGGSTDTSADFTDGTTLITWSKQFDANGQDIILSANNSIRIYSIKITK